LCRSFDIPYEVGEVIWQHYILDARQKFRYNITPEISGCLPDWHRQKYRVQPYQKNQVLHRFPENPPKGFGNCFRQNYDFQLWLRRSVEDREWLQIHDFATRKNPLSFKVMDRQLSAKSKLVRDWQ